MAAPPSVLAPSATNPFDALSLAEKIRQKTWPHLAICGTIRSRRSVSFPEVHRDQFFYSFHVGDHLMTRRASRLGFTLVELLVVISIIGMLMALLLPAVNAARESGRANTCRNNMRNLALAVISYESTSGAYPGYYDGIRSSSSNRYIGRPLVYMVFPQLERNDLYETYGARTTSGGVTVGTNSNLSDTSVKILIDFLQCPSNPHQTAGNISPTAFVYNCGRPNGYQGTRNDSFNNGVFGYRYNSTSRGAGNSSANLTSHDGTTNTLMLSENIGAQNQAQSIGGWCSASENRVGFMWQDFTDTQGAKPPYRINGNKGQRTNFNSSASAHPLQQPPANRQHGVLRRPRAHDQREHPLHGLDAVDDPLGSAGHGKSKRREALHAQRFGHSLMGVSLSGDSIRRPLALKQPSRFDSVATGWIPGAQKALAVCAEPIN